MPLPGTPHTARMAVLFTFGIDGQTCENIFHLQDSTDAIFTSPTATCNAVQTAANTHIKPALFPTVKLIGTTFEDVRTFPFGGLDVPQVAVAGTRAGGTALLPSSVSLSIKKVTGNLGRSGRGRWYWPLADVQAISGTNDTVNASYITDIEAALTAFQLAVETAITPAIMGVVSYRSGKVQRSAGVFQRIISWSNADATIDSQRRRLTGRGR